MTLFALLLQYNPSRQEFTQPPANSASGYPNWVGPMLILFILYAAWRVHLLLQEDKKKNKKDK